MAKIKDQIVITAKRLFMDNGYDQVSLRQIAAEAGTTIGNLTYHFPQKEDLIAALQEESQLSFVKGLFEVGAKAEFGMEHLIRLLVKAQKRHEEYSFYFNNMVELCKDFERLSQKSREFRGVLFSFFQNCCASLQEDGLMRADIKPRQFETLAYVLVMMISGWTQNHSIHDDPGLPKPGLVQAAGDILFPYLTDQGINDFEKFQLKYIRFDLPMPVETTLN